MWNTYTTVKDLKVSVSGLKESKRYKFRVAAKNIMGLSLFTETRQPVEIKEQMCKVPMLAWMRCCFSPIHGNKLYQNCTK